MGQSPFAYVPYGELGGEANVVLDGSPTDDTVLCLTHWPGFAQPAAHAADLSAQMAFSYLGALDLHGDARAVSNNHFDQDGLVSVYALTQPDAAAIRRDRLIDVANAGDFAVYRDREAARVSMVLSAFTDRQRSPLDGLGEATDSDELCGLLYRESIGRLAELCDHPDRYASLWEEEDATLTASEWAVESGDVVIDEVPELDLAIVTVADHAPSAGGHRFGGQWSRGLHPMALHNKTHCNALLVRHGELTTLTYRYESWVQFRSRVIRPRVDLAPLAEALSAEEPGGTTWAADDVSGLTPSLAPTGEGASDLEPDRVQRLVEDHLRRSAPAWDPYRVR